MHIKLNKNEIEIKAERISNICKTNLELINSLLKIILNKNNAGYIAGGYIRDLWLNQPYNDIDIFLYNTDDVKTIIDFLTPHVITVNDDDDDEKPVATSCVPASQVVSTIMPLPSVTQTVKGTIVYFPKQNKFIYEISDTLISVLQNELRKFDTFASIQFINFSPRGNLNISINNTIYQIILEYAGTPKDIINQFDFNINSNFFTHEEIEINNDIINFNTPEEVTIQLNRYCRDPRYCIVRAVKFIKKGFKYHNTLFYEAVNMIEDELKIKLNPMAQPVFPAAYPKTIPLVKNPYFQFKTGNS